MRDMLDGEIRMGRHESGFHTYFGAVIRILDKDYDAQPDGTWLQGQGARISRAHDFGESAELCADMIAKFWADHVLSTRARRASDPMSGCIRVVRMAS